MFSLPLLSAGADVFAIRGLFRIQTYTVFKEPPGIAAPGRGVNRYRRPASISRPIPAVRVSGKNFFFVLFLIHYGKMGTKHLQNSM